MLENLENAVGHKTSFFRENSDTEFENLENVVGYKTVSHAVIH